MRFWIQAGNPRSLPLLGKDVSDLSEAIEEVFPMMTEDAIIVWNRSFIPISYKFDLSVIIDELLPLLTRLLDTSGGCDQIRFGASAFYTTWNLTWTAEDLDISAQWHSVVGHIESVTADCNSLRIGIQEFLAEWKEVLKRVVIALQESSISTIDIKGFESLVRVESAIRGKGRLYQTEERGKVHSNELRDQITTLDHQLCPPEPPFHHEYEIEGEN